MAGVPGRGDTSTSGSPHDAASPVAMPHAGVRSGGGSEDGALVVIHAGVDEVPDVQDGADASARAGAAALRASIERGRARLDPGALAAVVAACTGMEEDPRFNTGSGSRLRLDGRTIQTDAAVMTAPAPIGYAAVAGVNGLETPTWVAARLLDSPHRILVGEGARRFAERHGLFTPARSGDKAARKYEEVRALAADGRLGEAYDAWTGFDLAASWNFPGEVPEWVRRAPVRPAGSRPGAEPPAGAGASKLDGHHADTVGAVARDDAGRMAVATSTGGTATMLDGRVGDSPIIGCGLFAGPAGVVSVTGEGEQILVRMLARAVYDRLLTGASPEVACRAEVETFRAEHVTGAIALTPTAWGWAANRHLPVALARP